MNHIIRATHLAVINENDIDDGETSGRIEDLARDLARTISAAPAGERERLRDMAVHLLRDEVEIRRAIEVEPTASGTVNPFAIGIPLILVGGVMLVMFPPVGILLFGAAAVMMVWGVASVLLVRREH